VPSPSIKGGVGMLLTPSSAVSCVSVRLPRRKSCPIIFSNVLECSRSDSNKTLSNFFDFTLPHPRTLVDGFSKLSNPGNRAHILNNGFSYILAIFFLVSAVSSAPSPLVLAPWGLLVWKVFFLSVSVPTKVRDDIPAFVVVRSFHNLPFTGCISSLFVLSFRILLH
jgi:hypothetical protein